MIPKLISKKVKIMIYMEIKNIEMAIEVLEKSPEFADLVPEVRSNIVMAKEGAKETKDVAGVPGRITTVKGWPKSFMKPDFGVSSHMARLVLSMMKHDPQRRSALNIRYSEEIVDICRKLGLKVSSYNRHHEPEDVVNFEGGTIPWGVEEAIDKLGDIPDVVYHTGGWGKEPMVCLTGPDALEVAKTAVCISKLYSVRVKKSKNETHTKSERNLLKNSMTISGSFEDSYSVVFAPSRSEYIGKKAHVSCTFCAIAEGNSEVDSRVLYKNNNNMIIMNMFPYNRGHLEVVPLEHVTDLNKLGSEEIKDIFVLVQRSIGLIREVLKPDGINVGINLGKAAGSSIKHLHIHIVPRFKVESGFMETTANTRVVEESIDETYTRFMEKIDILRETHEV